MNIVLDKSFLHGTTNKIFAELCGSHNVIMPESLFYELLTTSPAKRTKCFKKFPDIQNPVLLMKNIGSVLSAEVKEVSPFKDICTASLTINYSFNPTIKHDGFKFTDEQQQSISEWRAAINARVWDFQQKASAVSGWFPNLKGYISGADPRPIEKAKEMVCTDHKIIKDIYNQIRANDFPETKLISEHWALFREIQVYLMASLDYLYMYGDNKPNVISKKIENEYLDIEYCITALLVGALASKDQRMIERFKRIRPDGIVFN